MASGALALLLGLAHRIVIKDRLVRAGGWQRRFEHIGEGLQGKTLGLLGFGNIARELSLLARPLELRQIAYTPRLRPADAAARPGSRPSRSRSCCASPTSSSSRARSTTRRGACSMPAGSH